MNYFLVGKYQAIQENVLYSAKVLFNLLDETKHIDVLFMEYAGNQGIALNVNLERVLYLALTFLYSIGKIEVLNNMVKRVTK